MTTPKQWYRWAIVLVVLCGVGASGLAFSAAPAPAPSSGSCLQPPSFSLDEFGNKRFHLNTLCTTPYPPDTPNTPAWADVLVAAQNFVACKGSPIALCYYSGPETSAAGTQTPCHLRDGAAIADCTCFEIPPGSTYFVDINAILDLRVYLDTVIACKRDGSDCLPAGRKVAPVCEAIRTGTLFPGKNVDLISTFSFALDQKIPIAVHNNACTTQPYTRYAGCMTAPCQRTGEIDPVTGNFLVQCACPTYVGPFQVGTELTAAQGCELPGGTVWSAAYSTFGGGTFPTLPDCIPDAPGDKGCPLLLPNPPVIPAAPPQISCNEVCSEYNKSINQGIQVGYTCDATLCTAASHPALVAKACTGLDKHGVSEILRLEMAVGKSCAASQICGCAPNKKTNQEIWRLNEAQGALGIATQCDQNGTLCGTKP